MKYHNANTYATDPGGVRLSPERFHRLDPWLGGLRGWLWYKFLEGWKFEERVVEHMRFGDSRAACVMSIDPLLVAAYSDDIDCVAMLKFPNWLVNEHELSVGSKLLTVNTYQHGGELFADLIRSSRRPNGGYVNFFPVIAEFVSDDRQRIAERKAEISKDEWRTCWKLGQQYLDRFPGRCRNGSPLHCFKAAR